MVSRLLDCIRLFSISHDTSKDVPPIIRFKFMSRNAMV